MNHVAAAMGRSITFALCPDRQHAVLFGHSTLIRNRGKMLPWLDDAGVEEDWAEPSGGKDVWVPQADVAACTTLLNAAVELALPSDVCVVLSSRSKRAELEVAKAVQARLIGHDDLHAHWRGSTGQTYHDITRAAAV